MKISASPLPKSPAKPISTPSAENASFANEPHVPMDAVMRGYGDLGGDGSMVKRLGTMFKQGVHTAAFFGVPAAIGAASADLGASVGDGNGHGRLIGGLLGSQVAPLYGTIHGGYAGWAATPGKDAGGALLAVLTVPAGAAIGAVSSLGLSAAGSAFGWKVAAGAAGVGFLLGAINGFQETSSS